MSSRTFVYEDVVERIECLIRDGVLRAGEKAPSLRNLSKKLGVSISSVTKAYDILEGQGILEVWPQSGYYVKTPNHRKMPMPSISKTSIEATDVTKNDLISTFLCNVRDSETNMFACASPDIQLLPTGALGRLTSQVANELGPRAFDYQFPPGNESLRRQVAGRLMDGTVTPDDVVITTGGLDAINLCLSAVVKAGDVVVLESPTYFGLLQALENRGVKALEISTCPTNGINLDALDKALAMEKVKACLLIPNFNNPLGSMMPEEDKERLAKMLAKHQKPLIEDDIYGELYFGRTRPKPVKAFDVGNWVIHCSSFSKNLSPGLRVGYAASSRFAKVLRNIQFMSNIAAPTIPQEVIARFIAGGRYDRHLRELRKVFKNSTNQFTKVILESFPKGTKVSRPAGGFVLWLELPETINVNLLAEQVQAVGLNFAQGQLFTATNQFNHCIRLSCGFQFTAEVAKNIAILGKIARELC